MRDSATALTLGRAATVLVVDDNVGSLESICELLRVSGLSVVNAVDGTSAIAIARTQHFDLALVDYYLPDMTGLDVISALRAQQISRPWILMSAFMDFDLAIQAGRLGALRAISTPFDIEAVVFQALSQESLRDAGGWPCLPIGVRLAEGRSAVKRSACLILKACDSVDDLTTLSEWAAFVGVSYTQLRDSCYRIGVQPHDARDFMRVLRVLIRANGAAAEVLKELNIHDYRTATALLERAGLVDCPSTVSIDDFLNRQRFIDGGDPLATAVRTLLTTL